MKGFVVLPRRWVVERTFSLVRAQPAACQGFREPRRNPDHLRDPRFDPACPPTAGQNVGPDTGRISAGHGSGERPLSDQLPDLRRCGSARCAERIHPRCGCISDDRRRSRGSIHDIVRFRVIALARAFAASSSRFRGEAAVTRWSPMSWFSAAAYRRPGLRLPPVTPAPLPSWWTRVLRQLARCAPPTPYVVASPGERRQALHGFRIALVTQANDLA